MSPPLLRVKPVKKSPKAAYGGAIYLHPEHPKPGADRVDVLLGSPTLGIIRMEWHNAMVGCVSPPNWALVRSTPCGYLVADAQNMLVDTLLRAQFRALLLIEDDTIPPADAFLTFDRWFWKMERKLAPPVVSGLYHIKGSAETRRGKTGGIMQLGPEPLAYRGSGSRAFRDWSPGDVIRVSGVPTGALLIHRSVLEAWANEPDIELYTLPGYPFPVRKIFQQPSRVWMEDGGQRVSSGTSDLWWSDQTMKREILKKAGWPKEQARDFPYIIDTSLRFGHIDPQYGRDLLMANLAVVVALSLGRSPIGASNPLLLVTVTAEALKVSANTVSRILDLAGVGEVAFNASPDHASITDYTARVRVSGNSTVVDSQSLGVPTPDGNNVIIVDLTTLLSAQAAGNYTVSILATSAGGSTDSAESAPFSVPL